MAATPEQVAPAPIPETDQEANRERIRQLLTQPKFEIDVSKDPKQGLSKAPVQLVEFSDFLCPACQRASLNNVAILLAHWKEVSVSIKHFPLDTSCNDHFKRMLHPGACQLAEAAECAHEQGEFWKLQEHLFTLNPKEKPEGIREKASELGLDMKRFEKCLSSGSGMTAVKKDIEEAAKIGVHSTPTYLVNGIRMTGVIDLNTFEQILEVFKEQNNLSRSRISLALFKPLAGGMMETQTGRRKILLVEDEPHLAKTVGKRLEISGFEVVVATDGGEALQQAQAMHPDLMVLDLELPLLDGLEVCRRLRAQQWGASLPVIVFSSNAEKIGVDEVACQRAGASAFVSRAQGTGRLVEMIEKFLKPPT